MTSPTSEMDVDLPDILERSIHPNDGHTLDPPITPTSFSGGDADSAVFLSTSGTNSRSQSIGAGSGSRSLSPFDGAVSKAEGAGIGAGSWGGESRQGSGEAGQGIGARDASAETGGRANGREESEEMTKLMESIELTKKATLLQQRLALASFKAQRGWSELSLKEIEPRLPLTNSPSAPPSGSASPIRRRRSRANLSNPSPSIFPYDPTAPPLPGQSLPSSPTSSSGRFAPYGVAVASGTGAPSRSRGMRLSASAGPFGVGSSEITDPASSSRNSFPSPSRQANSIAGPSTTPSRSRTRSEAQDGLYPRRRSSSSTLVAAIDLSNHGFAHGREGGPRIVSVNGTSGGRRIDSSPAGWLRRGSRVIDEEEDDEGDSPNGRSVRRRRSGFGMGDVHSPSFAGGTVPSPPMQRRQSDSLQSRMLGHRRILSGSASASLVGVQPQSQPILSNGRKYRSLSHSTYRPAGGLPLFPDGRTNLSKSDDMDVDAANALTSMLGSGPGNSPLRASFAPQFAKPRAQSFAVGAGPYESPPRRPPSAMLGLAAPFQDDGSPRRSDTAIEEASSDEDKKAAELMIFLAQSPSPSQAKRREPMNLPPSIGRILFEDQLAEKQKASPLSLGERTLTGGDESPLLRSPHSADRQSRGVSVSATSSLDSIDQPTTPPARYEEVTGNNFPK